MQSAQGFAQPLLRSGVAQFVALAQIGHHRSDLSFAEAESTEAREDLGLYFDYARRSRLAIEVAIGVQDAQGIGSAFGTEPTFVQGIVVRRAQRDQIGGFVE